MDCGINVRRILSKDLLEYDRRRKEQNATWDDIDWEENKLESGTGSEDCETHLKIVNVHQPYKELFELQRKAPLEEVFDVLIIAEDGYVPCHSIFLLKKSEFLDRLIVENLKVNAPSYKNHVTIRLMEVALEHLQLAITLLYTGTCFVADNVEEDEVKGILRLLQIDGKKYKIDRDPFGPNKAKKRKFKKVGAIKFGELNDSSTVPPEIQSVADGNVAGSSRDGMPTNGVSATMSDNSNQTAATTSTSRQQFPRQPTTDAVAKQLPAISKVPAGTLIHKKQTERIQRNADSRKTSVSSAGQDNEVNENDSEEDENATEPPQQYNKVAPGDLIPKNKQPRIIRNPPPQRERGGRSNKRRGSGRKQTSSETDLIVSPEDEDSNGPKGKYEQDHEYVPSGVKIYDDGIVEITDDEEEEITSSPSDDEERVPCTRNGMRKSVGKTNSRYSMRQRLPGSSSVTDDFKETDTSSKTDGTGDSNRKDVETDQLESENIPNASRGTRRRGKSCSAAIAKGTKKSTRMSTAHMENYDVGHRCSFCSDTYVTIEELKSHLDTTNCARHLTGTYDIFTKKCHTCQSFFKLYNASEFMDHVKVCVCNLRPGRERKRVSSGKSNATNSPCETPTVSPAPPQQKQNEVGVEKNFKQQVHALRQRTLDIVGLTKIQPCVDKLGDAQITKIIEKIRNSQTIHVRRPTCPPGHRYVYDCSEIEKKNTLIPSKPISTSPTILAPPSLPPPQVDPSKSVANDETFSSVNTSTFTPAYVSTPMSPERAKADASKKTKEASKNVQHRPAPASVQRKRKAKEASDKKSTERYDGQQSSAAKKSRPDPDYQKQNNEASSVTVDSGSNAVPGNTDDCQTQGSKDPKVDNTAKKLRDRVKNNLHSKYPPAGVSTSKETHSVEKTVVIASKTCDKPIDVPNEVNNQKNSNSNSNQSSNQPTGSVQQHITQQQQLSLQSVGAVISKVIEKIVRDPETTILNNTQSEKQPTEAIPAEKLVTDGESRLLQQHSSSNAKTNANENQADSLKLQTQKPAPIQLTASAPRNPRAPVSAGYQSMESLSAILGVPKQSGPRLPPPQTPQQPTQAPLEQNYVVASSSNQLQTISKPHQLHSANNVISTAQNPPLTQSQQVQLSNQQQTFQMFQQQAPNMRPASVLVATTGTSHVTAAALVISHEQNPQQTSRAPAVHPNTHSSQIVQRTASQPSLNSQGLEVRRVKILNGPLPNNPSNQTSFMPSAGNIRVAQQQQYMQQGTTAQQQYQNQQRATPSAPVNTVTSHAQTSSVNVPLVQSRLAQNQGHSIQSRPNSPLLQQQQLVERAQHIMSIPQQQRQPQITFAQPGDVYMNQQALFHRQQQQQFQRASSPAISTTTMMSQGQMMQYASPSTTMQPTLVQTNPHQASVTGHYHAQSFVINQSINSKNSYMPPYGGLPAQLMSNGGLPGSITTVRLPVTAQMNPLANNRSIQMHPQIQQQSHILAIEGSLTSTSLAPSAATTGSLENIRNQATPSANNSATAGPGGNVLEEERTFNCSVCGVNFNSKENMDDHIETGMCY